MKEFRKQLELIALVYNNYEHIQQLETLISCYKSMKEDSESLKYSPDYNLSQEQIELLQEIAEVSRRARYNSSLYEDPLHITNQLKEHNLKQMVSFKEKYYNRK